MILTEHGVFVRESYLAAAAAGDPPASRFVATRLARGLARGRVRGPTSSAPVTEANAQWEQGLGIHPGKILVVNNGLADATRGDPSARSRTGSPVGRIDPLKDVDTCSARPKRRSAASRRKVLTIVGHAPVRRATAARAGAARAARFGDRFRFMGRTTDRMESCATPTSC